VVFKNTLFSLFNSRNGKGSRIALFFQIGRLISLVQPGNIPVMW